MSPILPGVLAFGLLKSTLFIGFNRPLGLLTIVA